MFEVRAFSTSEATVVKPQVFIGGSLGLILKHPAHGGTAMTMTDAVELLDKAIASGLFAAVAVINAETLNVIKVLREEDYQP